mmetsp:Transcript_21687/g.60363  ORF Transcript_21687/g.60363 Transcript_21687/m.60363 type:complete len:258 (-) Transcript_21687:1489-2262(-)
MTVSATIASTFAPATTSGANASAAISSVLMIGATGRMGVQLINSMSKHEATNGASVEISAFCRAPDKLDAATRARCAHVYKGDARRASDLEYAIHDSNADLVLVAVGNGDDVSKSDIREANAKALVRALTSNPAFEHVRVFVVSSNGAGPTKIKAGFGLGLILQYYLRHVMKDHTNQENVFLSGMKNRVGFVRPTALTDGKPTGHMKTFGDKDKPPSIQTDRADLADWVTANVVFGADSNKVNAFGSNAFNVTCVKK